MSRPLPRYTNTTTIDAAQIDKIVGAAEGNTLTNPMHLATAAELRGIPVQAKGVGGTQPGTDPAAETINRQHRLRRSLNR